MKLWDPRKPGSATTFYGHKDEVFDIAFNSTGTKLASVSADGTGRIYNVADHTTHRVLNGHGKSVSKVTFNGQGTKLLTASEDTTCRLWDVEEGTELQVLKGMIFYNKNFRS